MQKINKVNINLVYQKDLQTTLVTISSASSSIKDISVLQLDDKALTSLYYQVSEAYNFMRGKREQQTVDVFNPERSFINKKTGKQEPVTISSELYQNFMHLNSRYMKLKQANHILLIENKKLKQKSK